MSLERQIVDTKTGQVKSRGSLGENSNFVMFYRTHMDTVIKLQNEDGKAAALFTLLTKHMDQENALMVSSETLAEILGWSLPTVYRKIKLLKEKQFIQIAKSGTSNIYLINANIAWTTYGNKKEYAKFKANVLISKSEQDYKQKTSRFKQLDLLEDKDE